MLQLQKRIEGNKNMLSSFTYMFKEKDFWKKYFALFGFVLVANLLINGSGIFSPALNNGQTTIWYYILFFLGFIVMFVSYGYSISALRITMGKSETTDLPMVKVMVNFVDGLKVVLSGAVLVLSLFLLIFVLKLIGSIFSSIFGDILSVLFNVIIFFILLIAGFFGIAMCCRYVVKPSYLNFVNFKAAAKLINNNTGKYSIVFLVSVLSTAFIYLIAMLSVYYLTQIGYLGLVLYCILVSILWTYQIFVLAGLFSKAVEIDKI